MKKVALLLASAVLFGLTSCQKTKDTINSLTEFDIPYSSNFNVPATPSSTASTQVDVTTPDIPTNSSSIYGNNKTSADLVSEIKLTKLTISTTGANLDYLKSVSVYIKTASISEKLIATNAAIPTGVTSVTLAPQDVNIKDYINQSNIQFRVSSTISSSGTTAQTLKLDETVHVKATLLK